jgi:hypothetical protein
LQQLLREVAALKVENSLHREEVAALKVEKKPLEIIETNQNLVS